MARYTQNDLRKMYEAPPQELTEKIHESITFLPLREQEERSMKRKLSLSTVIAIALVIVLMATALAAATNDTINDLVYRVWPDLALTLKPVNLACTDQGIKVEVVSAVAGNNEIVITYTAQDLLGDRLGSGGSAFGDIDTDFVETPDPSIEAEGEGEGFANFSTEEGKIIGAARMVWNTNGIAEGDYITFSLQSVDPGREILHPLIRVPIWRRLMTRSGQVLFRKPFGMLTVPIATTADSRMIFASSTGRKARKSPWKAPSPCPAQDTSEAACMSRFTTPIQAPPGCTHWIFRTTTPFRIIPTAAMFPVSVGEVQAAVPNGLKPLSRPVRNTWRTRI